jgi:hypothetical protein
MAVLITFSGAGELVHLHKGKPVTDSLTIAREFGRFEGADRNDLTIARGRTYDERKAGIPALRSLLVKRIGKTQGGIQ